MVGRVRVLFPSLVGRDCSLLEYEGGDSELGLDLLGGLDLLHGGGDAGDECRAGAKPGFEAKRSKM